MVGVAWAKGVLYSLGPVKHHTRMLLTSLAANWILGACDGRPSEMLSDSLPPKILSDSLISTILSDSQPPGL